jgi:hypothetical protein
MLAPASGYVPAKVKTVTALLQARSTAVNTALHQHLYDEVQCSRDANSIFTRGVLLSFTSFAPLKALPCVESNGMPLSCHHSLTIRRVRNHDTSLNGLKASGFYANKLCNGTLTMNSATRL